MPATERFVHSGRYPLYVAVYSDENVMGEHNKPTCEWIALESLVWTKSGRRFQTVGHIQTSGRLGTLGDMFPNTKYGFNGRQLLVSTNIWSPFVSRDGNNSFKGFCMDLLDHMATSLNFTYRLTMPEDGAWGMQMEDGNFNGLIGQMQRNEIDMIMAPVSIQRNREAVMDFSYPFFYEPTKLLLRKLDPSDTKWRTLIDPFSPTVLICIGMSLPAMSFVLYMLEHLSPYYRNIEERGYMRGLHHFSDSFWYMYGALLTQGGEHMSDSISGRTLLSFWWLFCIMMMATYSGNLIAFFTVSKDKLPFDTIHGMVTNDGYKWGTIGGSSMVDILKSSNDHVFQELWQGILRFNHTDKDVLSLNPEIHINKVLQGKYAYLGDKTYNEITMVDNCDLVMTKEEFFPLQYAVGLPNNSPYTKIFSDLIVTIHESGLLQIWKLQHWPTRNFCGDTLMTHAIIVSLEELQSAFYLIGIGLVIASIALLYECMRSHLKNRYSKGSNDEQINHKSTKKWSFR